MLRFPRAGVVLILLLVLSGCARVQTYDGRLRELAGKVDRGVARGPDLGGVRGAREGPDGPRRAPRPGSGQESHALSAMSGRLRSA